MGNIPGMNATAPKIEPDTNGLRWLKHAHPRAATRNAEERAAQQAALVRLTGDTARCFRAMNGNGVHAPRKRTVIVPPAQAVELDARCEDESATFWRSVCVRSRPVPSMSR